MSPASALADAPGADSPPPFPPPSAWWCCPSQFTQSLSATSRYPRASSGLRPGWDGLAGRFLTGACTRCEAPTLEPSPWRQQRG